MLKCLCTCCHLAAPRGQHAHVAMPSTLEINVATFTVYDSIFFKLK